MSSNKGKVKIVHVALPKKQCYICKRTQKDIDEINKIIFERFQDEIGLLHQQLGKICDQVILMTAGFPIHLK